MRASFLRFAVVTLGLLGAIAGVALAGTQSPRLTAETTIESVSAVPANAKLAAEPLENATRLLKRADDVRAAGDHEHAALLEAVAVEWAESGRDLVCAAESEATADALSRQAAEVEQQVARARALLEQTVARRGRAQARLDELQPPSSESEAEGSP